MSLVVLGGHSLAELEAMARSEFGLVKDAAAAGGKIPSSLRPTFEAAGPPFSGGFLHVLPAVKAGHVLHVAFCLPPLLGRRYRAKAEEYCSHLVGHEGAGSRWVLHEEEEAACPARTRPTTLARCHP
jgi:nardilysin